MSSNSSKYKVGIIGKGHVGGALSRGLERAGHQVRSVGNDPKGVVDTANWAEIVILAVPYQSIDDALKEMGRDVLNGKILLDATNVVTPEAVAALGSKSGAEAVQSKVPGSKVVKAFNTHFAQNMDTGKVGGEQITLLVAGDDKDAKGKVLQLGRDIGFDVVDAGPLQNARLLESLGRLAIQLGYPLGLGTSIGFKLVRARS